jgi:poly(A) polymerase
MPRMVEPRVVPRAEHAISRRAIDPDALKVLYRLRQFNHAAYLVGGSVRDLLLDRRPKDFDIGTSAHPYQVKKLFRNCWIIGRRFRLAHVKFGPKVIEVATFRRQVQPGEEVVQDGVPAPDPSTVEGQHLIHHDNTFGTPEEDAFRRDFTINALFYDIDSFSIIDYVGGLDDLRAGIVRSIGDPDVRFQEDPVRMLRAIALASRLGFEVDPPVLDAIKSQRHEIARSAPPRLLEEYYKILRSGYAESTFRALMRAGLLQPVSAELHNGAGDALWRSLAALDRFRRQYETMPGSLSNALLLGSLLVPLGFSGRSSRVEHDTWTSEPRLGLLPLARRDVERLRQTLALQRRLRDVGAHPRAQRGLVQRSSFTDALTWMEIHGGTPETVAHWRALTYNDGDAVPPDADGNFPPPFRRRRRRRRRRRSPQIS